MDNDTNKMPPPPRPTRPTHSRNAHSLSAITRYSLSLLPLSFGLGQGQGQKTEDVTTEPMSEKESEIGLAISPGLNHQLQLQQESRQTRPPPRPSSTHHSMDALMFPTKARPSTAVSSAITTSADSARPILEERERERPRERVQSVTSLYRHVDNSSQRERTYSTASYHPHGHTHPHGHPHAHTHPRQHLSSITNIPSPMHRKSHSISSPPTDCPNLPFPSSNNTANAAAAAAAAVARRHSNRKRILRANPKALSTYAPGLTLPTSRTNSFTNLDEMARVDNKRPRTYSTTDELGRQIQPREPIPPTTSARIDDSWSSKWKRWSGYGYPQETSWRKSTDLSPSTDITNSRRNSTASLPTEPGFVPYTPQPLQSEFESDSDDDHDRYWKAY